jgi:hypothetical protein
LRWPFTVRGLARVLGEVAVLWLLAAGATASFLPRGFGPNAEDRLVLLQPSFWSGVGVAAGVAAGCAGLWWLVTRELPSQLGLAALGLLALSLVLPGGLTPFFLPAPLALLLCAFLQARFPDDDGAAPPRSGGPPRGRSGGGPPPRGRE